MRKLRSALSYFYRLPWCVPDYGWEEFWACFACVLQARVVEGPYPEQFAEQVRLRLGFRFAIPVKRARVAIELAIRGLQLGPLDEVVVPSYICGEVPDAVRRAGAKVVFADVGPDLHMTPESVLSVVTERTRCVIVAHLFGNIAPVAAIRERLAGRGIVVIDSAAQGFGCVRDGRQAGSWGDMGVVSCGAGKPLVSSAGGVLLTDDPEVHRRARSLLSPPEPGRRVLARMISFWIWRRLRGWSWPFFVLLERLHWAGGPEPASLGPMTNIEAALALCQLARLQECAARRRANAEILLNALPELRPYCISDRSSGAMLLRLTFLLPPVPGVAQELIRTLASDSVDSQIGYLPCHRGEPEPRPHLANTEDFYLRVLQIPVERPAPPLRNTARLLAGGLLFADMAGAPVSAPAHPFANAGHGPA